MIGMVVPPLPICLLITAFQFAKILSITMGLYYPLIVENSLIIAPDMVVSMAWIIIPGTNSNAGAGTAGEQTRQQ